jgi:hypothetical protein
MDFFISDEELDAILAEEDHTKTVAHLWHDLMCTGNADGTGVLGLRWPEGHLGMEHMDVIFLDFDTTCHLSLVKNAKPRAFNTIWPELVAFCRKHGVQQITLSDSSWATRDVWGDYGFDGDKGDRRRTYYVK